MSNATDLTILGINFASAIMRMVHLCGARGSSPYSAFNLCNS